MSIWTRIIEALKALANGEGLSALFERLTTPPDRSVAFTIAVISLGAKMAKADGTVSTAEVRAFREIFRIAPEDEAAAARVFNLARQDTAGFETYARRIGRMFADDPQTLENLLEGLLHISTADGFYQEEENAFLSTVAVQFGISQFTFQSLRARYVPGCAADPFTVLGVPPDMALKDIRAHWKNLVRETHPDRLAAHGLPSEAILLATKRLSAINNAWDQVRKAA